MIMEAHNMNMSTPKTTMAKKLDTEESFEKVKDPPKCVESATAHENTVETSKRPSSPPLNKIVVTFKDKYMAIHFQDNNEYYFETRGLENPKPRQVPHVDSRLRRRRKMYAESLKRKKKRQKSIFYRMRERHRNELRLRSKKN